MATAVQSEVGSALERAMVAVARQRWLDPFSRFLKRSIARVSAAGGPRSRNVENFLYGVWLGHPLHPALTDIPLGAWSTAVGLDALDTWGGHRELAPGADAAIAIGLAGAAGSLLTGLNDWRNLDDGPSRIGLAHAGLNGSATLLYSASLLLRWRGKRTAGRGCALLGLAAVTAGAYLGGGLVFRHRIGVDRAAGATLPPEFTTALAEHDLPEGVLRSAHIEQVPVVLVRRQGGIYALADTCGHLGCSLAQYGELEGESIRCTCHGSRFALGDGRVLDGPSTFRQPSYDVRVRGGQIEVRMRRSE
ncbi:MAG: Rieske 2Fe-2S domain-containing protein [Chloroflexi bacterium]|nr:Rieske 2Fe-2S domain-containing protein [Chloroflexota bacterium]